MEMRNGAGSSQGFGTAGRWGPEHLRASQKGREKPPGCLPAACQAGAVGSRRILLLCVILSVFFLSPRYQSLNLTHVPEHSAPIYEFR